ncbi:divergent polysaccharide deacetylase family protein [Falsihalocynthiibacter sp. BN13B15]|uniref:divergent polysaccharide deacetylase family protein n=1 Tax=Falsihalocynthiibacter sp. BN13B15 TaxID=3240871 RepID=UPI0035101A6E
MGGVLKGALLGLACAFALIVVAVVVAPDVDPAKYSEAPIVGQEDAPEVAAPEVPAEVEAAQSESPVQTQDAPQTPAVEETPAEPDLVTTTPAIVVDPALPKPVQTPLETPPAEIVILADPTVDVGEGATGLPAPQSEELSDVLTQNAAPIEAQQTQPASPAARTLEPSAESTAVLPQENQPQPQSKPERTQSNAESEDGPPSVQFESPQPPRATERPVVTEGFGTPVGTFNDQENALVNRAPSVRVNRLPSVSQDGEQEVASDTIEIPPPSALRDNRASFQATGKPLIGILLLEGDDRSEDADRLALIADFGVPLSIGIDPTSEGASERAYEYYDAGAEIIVLSSLPENASPQDVEVTLAQYQVSLPMAVAMMELPSETASRTSRSLWQHVIAILHDRGYGLVAENVGLNTAVQLASKTGVPHVQVFYGITPEETQDRLRTIFNRAIFRATQKGAAVVTAPSDVTALTALKAWALVDRPSSVQIAPISAVLLEVAPQ